MMGRRKSPRARNPARPGIRGRDQSHPRPTFLVV